MNKNHEEAYQEGYRAHGTGAPEHANPYCESSMESEFWSDGWEDAFEDEQQAER